LKVFVLVWCKNKANAETSLLTFKTIRTGFPSAEIVIVDNASILGSEVQQIDVGAQHIRLNREVSHAEYLGWILMNEDNAVIVDPDIVFWEKVEDWDFSEYLMAGRLLPHFYDKYSKSHTVSRLHTSFLWFPDLVELRKLYKEKAPYLLNPIAESMVAMGSKFVRWDTMASLYHMFKDRAYCFSDKELDSYDHLFCGTHVDMIYDLGFGKDTPLEEGHNLKGDSLKGHWRKQEEYLQDHKSDFLDKMWSSLNVS